MSAYTGKVLWVDLTTGSLAEESIPEAIYKKYLGGVGLGAYLLHREMAPGADALGEENILGFMSGLLTGTGSLFTGRWMVVGKSPLTGTWGDSNCGGNFAFAIKQCGYDGILFKGISKKPVYLHIDNHGASLIDAESLWGKDTQETTDFLVEKHGRGRRAAVAVIGPAGEKQSLLASIVNDKGRMAARSGLGAVMGSKRLKAIVLGGNKKLVKAYDMVKVRQLSRQCGRRIRLPLGMVSSKLLTLFGEIVERLPMGFTQSGYLLGGVLSRWGTVGTFTASVGMGDTPFKNWKGTKADMPDVSRKIDPDDIRRSEKRKYHCSGCPLGCGGLVTRAGTDHLSHKPEYETTASFTTMLLNDDAQLLFEVNELLDRAGMDSISCGAAVAFAMECYENGWVTIEDTGGIELRWGNAQAIRTIVRQMTDREGFGALLADGTKKAAARLGKRTAEAAMQAGGQEIAYHDPRFDPGMALHASVDPTPGRHTTGSQLYYDMFKLWTKIPRLEPSAQFYDKSTKYDPGNGRTANAVAVSEFTQVYACLGMCYFGMLIGVDRVPIFEWANSVTGWDYTPEEWLRIGRRIQTLRQMFNIREGIDPWSLRIHKRLTGDPPQSSGPNKGVRFDLDALMRAYWKEIGWDDHTGIPTEDTLRELELLEDLEIFKKGKK